MQRRINGRGGAAWVTAAAAAMLAACQPAATPANTAAANDVAAENDVQPTMEATPAERQLGAFATEAEAVAAAKQAGLAPGASASATIDGEKVQIVRNGDTYLVALIAAQAGSGPAQRPPVTARTAEP